MRRAHMGPARAGRGSQADSSGRAEQSHLHGHDDIAAVWSTVEHVSVVVLVSTGPASPSVAVTPDRSGAVGGGYRSAGRDTDRPAVRARPLPAGRRRGRPAG